MSVEQSLAFILFAIVAAITPGPSNIILASTGAMVGVRRGLPTLFGVAIGMGLMLFVVAFGLGNLLFDRPAVLTGLKWSGIGVLFWLSWKIATAGRAHTTSSTSVIGFWRATAFQWVNPKSWLIIASAVGAYLRPGDANAFAQSGRLGALFVLAALPCCGAWLAFGAALQRLLHTERAARAFNVAMGATLASSVILFVR